MLRKSSIRVQVGDVLISRSPIFIVNRPWYGIRITEPCLDHTNWVPLSENYEHSTFETWEEASLKAQSLGLNPIVVDFEIDYKILHETGKVVKFHSSSGSKEDR
jgi:hypothetical protein